MKTYRYISSPFAFKNKKKLKNGKYCQLYECSLYNNKAIIIIVSYKIVQLVNDVLKFKFTIIPEIKNDFYLVWSNSNKPNSVAVLDDIKKDSKRVYHMVQYFAKLRDQEEVC